MGVTEHNRMGGDATSMGMRIGICMIMVMGMGRNDGIVPWSLWEEKTTEWRMLEGKVGCIPSSTSRRIYMVVHGTIAGLQGNERQSSTTSFAPETPPTRGARRFPHLTIVLL